LFGGNLKKNSEDGRKMMSAFSPIKSAVLISGIFWGSFLANESILSYDVMARTNYWIDIEKIHIVSLSTKAVNG